MVGCSMPWGEAVRLTERLFYDPSSHVSASVAGWEYPASWATIVAMADYDLKHQIAWRQAGGKGARPKPYPRPWPDRVRKVIKPSVSQDEVIAALRFAGHVAPIPTR